MLPLAFRDFFHSRIGSFPAEKRMDLETPNRSQNQLVRTTFQGSSFRSFALPPRGSALVIPTCPRGGVAGSAVLAERLPSSGGRGSAGGMSGLPTQLPCTASVSAGGRFVAQTRTSQNLPCLATMAVILFGEEIPSPRPAGGHRARCP